MKILKILLISGIGYLILRGVTKPQPIEPRTPPCGDYGDVDGDGYVTEADAEIVASYVVGQIDLNQDQLSRAAVRGIYPPRIADAQAISRYAKGQIDTFPVCGV